MLQAAGLEWLWRLVHNPRRLGKRYALSALYLMRYNARELAGRLPWRSANGWRAIRESGSTKEKSATRMMMFGSAGPGSLAQCVKIDHESRLTDQRHLFILRATP